MQVQRPKRLGFQYCCIQTEGLETHVLTCRQCRPPAKKEKSPSRSPSPTLSPPPEASLHFCPLGGYRVSPSHATAAPNRSRRARDIATPLWPNYSRRVRGIATPLWRRCSWSTPAPPGERGAGPAADQDIGGPEPDFPSRNPNGNSFMMSVPPTVVASSPSANDCTLERRPASSRREFTIKLICLRMFWHRCCTARPLSSRFFSSRSLSRMFSAMWLRMGRSKSCSFTVRISCRCSSSAACSRSISSPCCSGVLWCLQDQQARLPPDLPPNIVRDAWCILSTCSSRDVGSGRLPMEAARRSPGLSGVSGASSTQVMPFEERRDRGTEAGEEMSSPPTEEFTPPEGLS
mmetsp:Transcript_59301/g.166994  ORF Transcript_59301/g.166994 Transcript_59301/m.166994 type:complete len:347 (-) Transcript_59301:748-1788(-)